MQRIGGTLLCGEALVFMMRSGFPFSAEPFRGQNVSEGTGRIAPDH
jgi:hypothetical protein